MKPIPIRRDSELGNAPLTMRKALRAICVAAALGVVFGIYAPPALAENSPSPEALQAARELVGLVSEPAIDELNKRLTDEVWQNTVAALRKGYPNVSDAALAELRQELERARRASVRESMNAAAAIYAHHFTVAEMHAIVAFYKTPAGAKALKMMPTVTEEFAMATGPELLELQQKTGAAVGKFVKLLQKSKADAAPKK